MNQKEDKQTRTFRELLAKYQARYQLSVPQMCELMGVKKSTFYALKKDVSRADIKMLRRMRVALQIPIDELKEVI